MRATIAALATILIIASSVPAYAGWGPQPIGVPICNAFGDQHLPQSVPDGDGGVFLVWVDLRAGGFDLYAQRVDASGTPLWTANGVPVCKAAGLQDLPALTADGNGGVIVAWEDLRGADFDIYAQRFNASGVRQWAVDGVKLCGATGEQSSPSIVADAGGGAIVAWTDFRAGAFADIQAQRVNAAGVAQWATNGVALCTAVNDQDATTLVSDGANGAIAVWSDFRSGTQHDVYARRITAAGVPQWTGNGVALCTATDEQLSPVACSDGAGGAIVAWFDHRGPYFDVYSQRVSSAGGTLWAFNGVAVCVADNDQQNPAVLADGAGGAFLAWEDARTAGIDDLYAQHLDATGNATWAVGGVAVCTAAGDQQEISLVTDARGGIIAGWMDARGANFDLYVQRLNGAGAAQWAVNGLPMCNASGVQIYPAFAPDSKGGVIAVWEDGRNGPRDLYAQRIERNGLLGGPEPTIASLTDVPDDQGGEVVVRWNPSLYESPALGATVTAYRLYRLDGAVKTLLAEVPAEGFLTYESNAATLSDSTPSAANRTRFRVAAVAGAIEYLGATDSLASVDQIAPPEPLGLMGFYVGNQSRLKWRRSPAADFLHFRIHRGDNPNFTADANSLAATVTDTTFVESAPAGVFYKVVTVDRHGNASAPAWVQTETTLGVGDAAATMFAFARPQPNPSQGPATLRFSLPASARITLELFDEHGRRVRTLIAGELPAGEHSRTWDGRDDAGAVSAPGVYFARLVADGATRVQRLTRVE